MQYLIYGSKDFALILKDFLEAHEMPFAGFIDDVDEGPEIIGTFDEIRRKCDPTSHQVVLGIGYNNLAARWKVYARVKEVGYTVATLIHQQAYVRNPANIFEGAIVMANATVDCNAVVKEAAVLWPGVVVNHDSVIGENTFLSPSSTVCGFVNVGAHCFVGAGAVVVDHRDVPERTFVKAGALFKG